MPQLADTNSTQPKTSLWSKLSINSSAWASSADPDYALTTWGISFRFSTASGCATACEHEFNSIQDVCFGAIFPSTRPPGQAVPTLITPQSLGKSPSDSARLEHTSVVRTNLNRKDRRSNRGTGNHYDDRKNLSGQTDSNDRRVRI